MLIHSDTYSLPKLTPSGFKHRYFCIYLLDIFFFLLHNKKKIRNLITIYIISSYLFTQHLLHEQDETQGQFLSRVQLVWISTFFSPRLVVSVRLKESVCLTIYAWLVGGFVRLMPFPRILVLWEMWVAVYIYMSFFLLDQHYFNVDDRGQNKTAVELLHVLLLFFHLEEHRSSKCLVHSSSCFYDSWRSHYGYLSSHKNHTAHADQLPSCAQLRLGRNWLCLLHYNGNSYTMNISIYNFYITDLLFHFFYHIL